MTKHNRIASRLISSVLDAQGWSESKLAKHSGVARSVLSTHLSGARKIRPNHLAKYLAVLSHQEQPKLLAAWIRDNFPEDVSGPLLNDAGDNLKPEVREFVPPLDDENRRILAWLAREVARDGELADLVKRISAMAGYRPRRKATSQPKRRRDPRQKLSAFAAFIVALFNSAPPIGHQAHQVATAMASVAVPAVLAVSGTASPDNFAFVDWQPYQDVTYQGPQQAQQSHARPKKAVAHRQPRANALQRLADRTVNRQLQRLRRVVRHVASR